MANKKYYWLKLKRDFFKRHDIRIIEEMPNGKDYVLFYLKLLLESIDHDGSLRFSDAIPYNEQMLSVVTNTNVDVVKAAMKLFTELNMIEVYDDATIYMNEVERLIGSESDSAERVRRSRLAAKTEAKALQCNTDVTECNKNVTQSKRKRQSIEKETDVVVEDTDTDTDNDDVVDNSVDNSLELMGGSIGKGVVLLTSAQVDALLETIGFDAFNFYVDKLATFIIEKGAKVGSHYNTILKWWKEDTAV